jgi:hypothetical protein
MLQQQTIHRSVPHFTNNLIRIRFSSI